MQSTRCKAAGRWGAVTVEFALTAPILFMLVFASFEFSRANMLLHTAAIAATEGARKGITAGATTQEVQEAALSELTPLGINEARVLVEPETIGDESEMVTVGVFIPVNTSNFYLTPRFFLGESVIKVVSVTREAHSGAESSKKADKLIQEVATGLANGKGVGLDNGNSGNATSETPAADNSQSSSNSGSSSFYEWLKSIFGDD